MHEQHKKPEEIYVENLDDKKDKSNKDEKITLAHDLAEGKQDKFVIHMKVNSDIGSHHFFKS